MILTLELVMPPTALATSLAKAASKFFRALLPSLIVEISVSSVIFAVTVFTVTLSTMMRLSVMLKSVATSLRNLSSNAARAEPAGSPVLPVCARLSYKSCMAEIHIHI